MNDRDREIIVDQHQKRRIFVSYEDMANPRRVGEVVDHKDGEFRVWWINSDESVWSDLRQHGWRYLGYADLVRAS